MNQLVKLTIAGIAVAFIVGCSPKAVQETAPEPVVVEKPAQEAAPTAEPMPGAETKPMEPMQGFQGDPLDDPDSLLSKRKIYFDFDRSEVKEEFRDIVNAHAEYLAANPTASITLEGHADERGTREYNMALGERRANAVSQLLTLQGASKNQIRVISYGEERPESMDHGESAWQLNRRAVFVYLNR